MPAEAAEEVDQPAAEAVVEEAVGQVEQVEQVRGLLWGDLLRLRKVLKL